MKKSEEIPDIEMNKLRDYVKETLEGERGIAGSLNVPQNASISIIGGETEDYDPLKSQGFNQDVSKKFLASHLLNIKNSDVKSVLIQDPWSIEDDIWNLENFGTAVGFGGIYYILSIEEISYDMLCNIFSQFVSFNKILFCLKMENVDLIHAFRKENEISMQEIIKSVHLVIVNAFDDEGWISLNMPAQDS